VPVAALFGWLEPGPLRRWFIALALACVALNIWFLPSASYYYRDFYEGSPLSAGARVTFLQKAAPIRLIADYMNGEHPGAPVFLANSADIAGFNGEVYINGWQQYNVWMQILHARSPGEIIRLLAQWNVRYIVAPKPGFWGNIRIQTLQDLVDHCTTAEFQAAHLYLARLQNDCGMFDDGARAPLPLFPGFYDDSDPSIVFQGSWIRDRNWYQAYLHTLTYSNSPGSEIHIAFQGSRLDWCYTRAKNRGRADVIIDGVRQETVDLYSPDPVWQHRSTFMHLPRGNHSVVIRVLPDKNPASSDYYIDIDAVEVQ